MMILPEVVQQATNAPLANVRLTWPLVYAMLEKHGIATLRTQIGAIATSAVECPPFKPISEYGEHPEYDTGRLAAKLGNTLEADGDGQKYEGRGLIQITGRANYKTYGRLLGLDLEAEPDKALLPAVAAEILALYFKTRGVAEACDKGNWKRARVLVNGGLNGWAKFQAIVMKLEIPCVDIEK